MLSVSRVGGIWVNSESWTDYLAIGQLCKNKQHACVNSNITTRVARGLWTFSLTTYITPMYIHFVLCTPTLPHIYPNYPIYTYIAPCIPTLTHIYTNTYILSHFMCLNYPIYSQSPMIIGRIVWDCLTWNVRVSYWQTYQSIRKSSLLYFHGTWNILRKNIYPLYKVMSKLTKTSNYAQHTNMWHTTHTQSVTHTGCMSIDRVSECLFYNDRHTHTDMSSPHQSDKSRQSTVILDRGSQRVNLAAGLISSHVHTQTRSVDCRARWLGEVSENIKWREMC